jgi:hypothetical protein
MRRIKTFRLTTHRTYDGGIIRLEDYNIVIQGDEKSLCT